MAIYETAVSRATAFSPPTRRNEGGPAPSRTPSPEQGFRTVVTHELGHGLVEAGLTPRNGGAPDPQLVADYRRIVGWTAGSTPQLYDAGVDTVRTALANGNTPPSRYRITRTNWDSPGWVEQPLSSYMTAHPSEDMPEAVAYYVDNPGLLRSRSPRRHRFIATRFTALRPYLRPDLARVRLFPTDADALRSLQRSTLPPWLRPVEPLPSGTPPTPRLEIRF